MPVLKIILTWFFAMEAPIFLPVSLLIVWRIVHPVHAPTASMTPLKAVGLVAFFGVNFAFGLIYGMAWWATWKRKRSGRGWAIAASVTNAIMGFAPVALSHLPHLAVHDRAYGRPIWGLTAFRAAGLLVFWHRGAAS